jgi:hypothetical protein
VFIIHSTWCPCLTRGFETQIVVTFSEKKPRKSWFQVYMGEVRQLRLFTPRCVTSTQEEVPWEQWLVLWEYSSESLTEALPRIINAQVRQPQYERGAFQAYRSCLSG